ncbi:helix-turn-helix domain-containing protein [Membranihabitans marinus]|uniref:helix-turn-helix domain-containing protein n=1 Tax=Membranihabitans marinus TaxID=1227546 RepID=UPI001F1AC077|nr:helix-turn-helix domain-containing protein [Membranihabitans marinus]
MIEKEKYTELVERIIESPSFGHSNTYANLLRYLVDASLEGEIPKEVTIASQIFGIQDIRSDNTKVRVYIYNLRKKIKKYYETEGTEETIKLTIPTGGYAVLFEENKDDEKPLKSFKQRKVVGSVIGLLALIAITIYYQKSNSSSENTSYPIWTSFFASNKQNALVIGDLFIYKELDSATQTERTIRDVDINSASEFLAVRKTNQNTLPYSFLIRGSVEWVKSITHLFREFNEYFSIKFMTELNPKDLQDQNIVYVGMLKNAGFFRNYFNNSRFSYNEAESPSTIYYLDDDDKTHAYSPIGKAEEYHTDYGFVAKFPGPNNNEILLLGGIWDTGASQSLKNFTDEKLMREIEAGLIEKFGYIPPYFEILFEVNGINRTQLNTKMLHAHVIEESQSVWDVHE